MSNRRKPSGDLDSFSGTLAGVNDRIDELTLEHTRIGRGSDDNNSECSGDRGPGRISDVLAQFNRRLGTHLEQRIIKNATAAQIPATQSDARVQNHVQFSNGDKIAFDAIENRLAELDRKLNTIDIRLEQLAAIEQSFGEVIASLEELRTIAARGPNTTATMSGLAAQIVGQIVARLKPDSAQAKSPEIGRGQSTMGLSGAEGDVGNATLSDRSSTTPSLTVPGEVSIETSGIETTGSDAARSDHDDQAETVEAAPNGKPATRATASPFTTLIAARRAAFTTDLQTTTVSAAAPEPVQPESGQPSKKSPRPFGYLRRLQSAVGL